MSTTFDRNKSRVNHFFIPITAKGKDGHQKDDKANRQIRNY